MIGSQWNLGKIRGKYFHGSNLFSQETKTRVPLDPDFPDFEEFDFTNLKMALFEGTFLRKSNLGRCEYSLYTFNVVLSYD